MLYNTDRPIERKEDDLLGRSSFSEQLGKAIYEYSGNESLVIGLYGKWGTGKTSVANMALQTVESLSVSDGKETMIVRFAPWNYSSQDNLISQFFSSLMVRIENGEKSDLKKKVGKALQDYSGVFDVASLVPLVGVALAPILKTTAHVGGDVLNKSVDLNSSRESLEKALSELNQKIIVLIDDIDRLSNSQIRDVFQLVKQVGDLPNVIYVLLMDREIVKVALSDVHNIDGNEYLEKIIQIPFEIPELRKSKLHDIFFAKLDSIVKSTPQEFVLDQQYWNKVFNDCIEPYLCTLRDVNRVINTFQFKYHMLYRETAFEDLISLATIEVLEPDLYRWIADNKESVCGGLFHGLLKNRMKSEEIKASYEEAFKRIGVEPTKAINCISAIFPVFSSDVGKSINDYNSSSDIRSSMRAAHEEKFDLYFALDLESVKVSREVINKCLFSLSENELTKAVLEINSQGNIVYFLEEVRAMIDKIPDERLGVVASVLISVRNQFVGTKQQSIFPLSADSIATFCVKGIMKRMQSKDDVYDLYLTSINKCNVLGLGSLAQELCQIESAWARLGSNTEDKDGQIIDLEQLESLEKLYLQKIIEISKSENLLKDEGFHHSFFLWKSIDKESAENYLSRLFEDDFNKLRFVCGAAGRWTGTNGTGWTFYSQNYSEYLSDEEIYNLVQSFDKNRIDEFNVQEQIKLASFVLNYKKNEVDHVTEGEAIKLIKTWKGSGETK